jgi:hypothetical protein
MKINIIDFISFFSGKQLGNILGEKQRGTVVLQFIWVGSKMNV